MFKSAVRAFEMVSSGIAASNNSPFPSSDIPALIDSLMGDDLEIISRSTVSMDPSTLPSMTKSATNVGLTTSNPLINGSQIAISEGDTSSI